MDEQKRGRGPDRGPRRGVRRKKGAGNHVPQDRIKWPMGRHIKGTGCWCYRCNRAHTWEAGCAQAEAG